MSPPPTAAAPASPTRPRRAAQTGAPARRPTGPRRISGPARPASPVGPPERVNRPPVARAPSPAPFTQHVARVIDHSLLDRLIRGRTWIGLIGFALFGIVAMQVTLLKLNAGIGRSVERVTALQRESSSLAAQVAELDAAQRVQSQATSLGMVYAPPNDVRYLHVSSGDAGRAATAFVAPSAGSSALSTSTSSGPGTSGSSGSSTSASSSPATSGTTSNGLRPTSGATATASTLASGSTGP